MDNNIVNNIVFFETIINNIVCHKKKLTIFQSFFQNATILLLIKTIQQTIINNTIQY